MLFTKALHNKAVWNKIINVTLKLNMNMKEENLNVQGLHTDGHDTAQCV